MKAGLNLFSICNLIKTEENFLSTAKTLKEMGYDFMQFSGAKYDYEMIGRVVKESGLPIVLTHVPYDRIINEPEKLVEEHATFGCKYIGLGAMPAKYMEKSDDWRGAMDALNASAEKIAKLGGKFFYHHHQFEFVRLDNGQTAFDYMIENSPYVNFTLDSYWLQYAGVNPETIAEKLKGRIGCVHLKDYTLKVGDVLKYEFTPDFAPVGSGNLNMEKIIDSCRAAGTEYFIVEQDNASKLPDTLEQVKRSIDYLKKL